jgi:hypothetical protein
MKYIKKYEAKKNSKPQIDNEEVLKNYQYYIEDLDETSPITFDQFINNLDFNIFSNHDYDKFNEAGVYLPKNQSAGGSNISTLKIGDYTLYRSSEYGSYCTPGLQNNEDFLKRNAFFYAEVNTGGASGGSCWDTGDDDGAQPYEGRSLDLNDFIYSYMKPILEHVLSNQATTKTAEELCDVLYHNPNMIREDSRCNHEYYGNYDDYECYYMTFESLFKFLLQNEGL